MTTKQAETAGNDFDRTACCGCARPGMISPDATALDDLFCEDCRANAGAVLVPQYTRSARCASGQHPEGSCYCTAGGSR